MSTIPGVAPDAPATPINHIGRLFGVLFSPGKTFSDIAQRPTWVLPAVLLIVLSLLASVTLVQKVDWRDVVSQKIEKSPRAGDLSAEQKEQQIEMGAKFAPIFGYVGGLIFPVVFLLVTCLIMWGAYSLLAGVNPGFKTAFGITAHSFMTGLVSTPIFLLVVLLKPRGTIDIENPVATNLAAFLPEDSAKWLLAMCKQFDIFIIWTFILLAIGFAATNPKKLKGGKPFVIAFSVWFVYVLLATGIAWVFS